MPVQLEERREIAENTPVYGRNNRVQILDLLRGFSILYVMLYHLLYDLIWVAGVSLTFFHTAWWEGVHRLFLVILFGVSGICAGFSGNVLRRGTTLFLLGETLTLVTAAFLPDDVIVFGVLSCFGMSMLLYGVLSPYLKKLPNGVIFGIFALLTVLFWDFYQTDSLFLIFERVRLNVPHHLQWLYPIGIMSHGFHSADYFPLAPYGFIFLAGTALSDIVKSGRLPEFFYRANLPVINFCGRHSLWLYILHQPIFMGAVMLIHNS